MNFNDTLKSAELVLATGEVPLIVGESGIGKTALAKELAKKKGWKLIVIDGNLLKEGEIGGLPTIEAYITRDEKGHPIEKKTTVYAVHTKLREIDEKLAKGESVLLFIDEINRCEHTVQQELMNLILNREINGYKLHEEVKVLAAMNPSSKYGADFEYQVVDMDVAQENRFVWLFMESDVTQWLQWAIKEKLEQKVIAFISTFPEYLNKKNEGDVRATPRSFERISKSYTYYKANKELLSRAVFLNVVKGNIGRVLAEEFLHFIESDYKSLVTFQDVFLGETLSEYVAERIQKESHTRLYLTARNILSYLESHMEELEIEPSIKRLIAFIRLYPVDLRIGIMKDMKESYRAVYEIAMENEAFVALYFEAHRLMRG
ncbi:ATP-binding protein [Sporanaerobium hydrogeniformans]|uniref:ATP-binding protein n=1 Tax=Sporanaerobium hydrogeniformans TaxID=3072179 RepID=A0AC61DCR1_9FIRM|nr:ATP-binding protein [Sporanaerobium hydrogeniformans]PHV71025.1 ATP-binding protein [Sporanaerobium hydrogeniformans]